MSFALISISYDIAAPFLADKKTQRQVLGFFPDLPQNYLF
jgi:hypothetical protein